MDLSREKRQKLLANALLAPFFIMVLVVAVFPLIYALALSFTDRELFSTQFGFTGIDNYRWLWDDPEFWEGLVNTLIYAGSCTLFQIVAGLGTALLLVKKFKNNSMFRAIMTFPYLVPSIVAVLIFQWMLNDIFGVVNQVLMKLGILSGPIGWFGEGWAMFSVSLVSVWRFFPFTIMLFVPALEAIPAEYYEAAKVDGASPFRQFLHVTLPHIKEVMFVILVLRGIWMFNMFDIIYLLTGGGPVGTTRTIPILAYQQAFQEQDIGLASATATAGLIVLTVLMSFYMRRTKK